jgi:MinD-like ATPase involved in chromosome partitioning or flagellar assembly
LARTDTEWGRGDEPASRWRALLDRALHGRGAPESDDYDGRFSEAALAEAREAREARASPGDDYLGDTGRDGYGPFTSKDRPTNGFSSSELIPTSGPGRGDYGRAYVSDSYAPEYEDYGRYDSSPPRSSNGYQPSNGSWGPAPAMVADDDFVEALRRDLTAPHVLAFANPKGGVHKTTATVLAAATIGAVRGRGVLAWDDNELRGTLGLRAGSARHARTIRHLVRDLVTVEQSEGYDLHTRLDDYLRHASDGSYDVLAGEENPRFAQRLDPYTVKRVLDLLRRTHDVICVDTGNNVESPNWQTVLQASDQLVVTTVPREDAAFTADWMLDLLGEAGMGDMVSNAVTLLSCPSPNPTPLIDDLAAHFAGRTRAVVVVPYDAALESGSHIEYPDLAPATRRAWLQAAAVMMDPNAR